MEVGSCSIEKSFFPSYFEVDVKDSFGYNKEIKREKPYLQYKLMIYKHCLACILLIETLPSMYFRVNLKMKKPFLCCCFI